MKQFLFLILGVLFIVGTVVIGLRFSGLRKAYTEPTHPFAPPQKTPLVIAHRGGADEKPENTILAFDHAVSLGPQVVIELDVRLTKDDNLIVFHDETLDRTTNGTGAVLESEYAEILKLDAAFSFEGPEKNFPYRGKGISVPTLKSVFEKYPETRVVLEIKNDSKKAAEKTIKLIEEFERQTATLVASKHGRVMDFIREKKPNWILGASATEIYKTVILSSLYLETIDPMKADGYFIPEQSEGIQVLTERIRDELKRRHKTLAIWTINDDSDMKRLLDFGVDGVITDRPSRLLEIVRNSGQ